jgi:DNA-binding transcriptional MerR regulator
VTPKLYKAGEVCELLQVQPYVLRSWEKEFPGIGLQKSAETPRLYRQSDVEHVQRIKQLVFGEGLTVAGARRRLEASAPAISAVSASEAAEVMDALGADVRSRIAVVRDGLRQLQSLLSDAPRLSDALGASNGHAKRKAKPSAAAARSKAVKRGVVRKTSASSARKKASPKRRRA